MKLSHVGWLVLALSGCGPRVEQVELAVTPNPWPSRRNLDFAHQGGAREAPSNTLHAYAYRPSSQRGGERADSNQKVFNSGGNLFWLTSPCD
jgi:hypothetical protein